ncbi:MAG: hypothetical protein JW982_06810 [Spirochaetes bacterium]|nr:hypothetical protein [Spirochaetota bacterium]
MDKEKIIINALVHTAQYSLDRGVRRDDILKSLNSLIDKQLFDKVKNLI